MKRRAFINPEATFIGVPLILIAVALRFISKNTGWHWLGYVGVFLWLIGALLCLYDQLFFAAMKRMSNRKKQVESEFNDKID